MAQTSQFHIAKCPSNVTGLSEDCSCEKEISHYLTLAKWSFGLFVFEFVGGLFSGSMALISDSLHVLLDGTENIVSAVVSKLAQKNKGEETLRKVGGRISATLLLFAGSGIIYEGWERIITPHRIEWYMTIIATIGLCVNLWQMSLHHNALAEHRNQTHFWQNWHLMSDISASVAVVIGGTIMLIANKWYWIDGVLSVGIGLLIVVMTGGRILGVDFHKHTHDVECNHKH